MGHAPNVSVFFDRIASSVSHEDLLRIQAAWGVASSAHAGQLRQSGEPYVTHPLAVASILFDSLEPDADALCAALLHDVVEDSDTSLASIRERFGPTVSLIVDGVSKLDKIRTSNAANSKEETLRKLVAAGGRDWRVFAVKLCDRLHNMRTLNSVGFEKRKRVATETHAVFFPLARYVGFQRIAAELEALSLRALHPWRCQVVTKWARYRAGVDRRRLAPFLTGLPDVSHVLPVAGRGDVSDATLVRCYGQLFEDRASRVIFSVPSVFIACASIEAAYKLIGALHAHFVFVPASFSCDASEGSASTKVLLGLRGPVAEFVFDFPRVVRGGWVRSVGESANSDEFSAVANATDNPGDFTRVLRDLLVEKSISVFSPKGQRLSLPRHASGLDFAFAIHTDLGLRANLVRVNGVLHKPSVELSSGDIVEVVTGNEIVARPEWEAILRSPRSRSKLRQWLRESARVDAAVLGRRLLDDASLSIGANTSGLGASDLLAAFGASNVDDLCRRVGVGELSAFAVASRLRGSGADRLIATTTVHDERSRVVLDGRVQAGVQFCDRCEPIPGDEIVASASPSGVRVHRVDCPKRISGRSPDNVFVPTWAAKILAPLPATVVVHSNDRRGLLADCAKVISDAGLNVVAVKTKSTNEGTVATALLEFTLLVRSRAKFEKCLVALRAVSGVLAAMLATA